MSEVSQLCATDNSNLANSGEVKGLILSPGSPKNCSKDSTFPYVVKTPRADSKLILQNMEEVLNSVKRKHKQKHRRKKEQKKKALQEAEAAAAENAANADAAKMSQKNVKHPLQESKKNVDEINTEIKSPMKNATILDHFSRTPKKHTELPECSPAIKDVPPAKKANAFEVMMNARNKTIGSNTPGREPERDEIDDQKKIVTSKRKMLLQEMAEKKGAQKRRLEEEERDAFIEKSMKQRAKRFKAMLVNGQSEKPEENPGTPVEKLQEETSTKTPQRKVETNRRSKRESRRPRRLSSVDSIPPVENVNEETNGFLAKLSSPIKKRDSLLGYFSKKPSPAVEIINVKDPPPPPETVADIVTPKRKRGRPPKIKTNDSPLISEEPNKKVDKNKFEEENENLNSSTNVEIETISTGRPKRQCSGKSKYDNDRSPSPQKIEEQKSVTRSRRKSTKPDQSEVEIIDLDCESPKQTPKKLAPLFIKAMPKPSPNPEMLKAKHDFLMSGVPEKMRLEMAKQKQYEQSYEEAIEEFPKVSHIMQFNPKEDEFDDFVVTFKFRIDDEDQKTPTRKVKKRALGTFTSCTSKDFRVHNKSKTDLLTGLTQLTQVENKRLIIKEWKVTYDRFPTFRCYNQLREKYRHFCALDSDQQSEQVADSFVVTRSSRSHSKTKFDPDAEEEKPPPSAPNGELLFTEKYKAMSSEQVLVNVAPVVQLKEFLSSWRGATRANDSNALTDLDDSNSSCNTNCNTVVLLGPSSSGKTNAVFALANEMNFNVLEINAGMKRTGKKLLQELQEATQSHQIRKDSTSKSKSLLRKSVNGLKKKKLTEEDLNFEQDQNARKSLILVEDADVIFEQHDAGFVDALYTLASTSKRPLIIVATNPNCHHLQRLINQNTISFSPPNVLNISKFLSVLSLIENCPIELNDLVSLYLFNRKHLRKTILEMQFYIQSGGDRPKSKKNTPSEDKTGSQFFASPKKRRFSEETSAVTETAIDVEIDNNKKKTESAEVTFHKGLFEFFTVCQNVKCRIPFPVDFDLLRTNLSEIFNVSRNLQEANATTRRKSKSPKKAWLSAANRPSVTRSLSDFYENLSVSTMIAGVQECEDRLTTKMSEDIAHCLIERAIEKNLAAGHYAYNLFDNPQNSITLTTPSPVVPLRSSRSLALDYEPSLRSICRSEKYRSNCERRGSRFYHYLRSSIVNLGSFATDHFDNACDILADPEFELLLSQQSQTSSSIN